MQFQPRIRNFKIKKLQRLDFGGPQVAHTSNNRLQTISHIVESVIDKMGGEDLFRSDNSNKKKHYSSDRMKDQDIIISNKESNMDADYDAQFIQRMDPRDKIISVPFHFVISNTLLENYQIDNIFSTVFFKTITKNMQAYLVNMLEIVVSVSFNELMDSKLKQNQCKDYASKNILLNVHSICKETFKALKERMLIQGIQPQFSLALIQLVDHTLTNSVKCLAPYYPQAPPTGKTPRIRQALLAIDRNYNSELDFLFTQNLNIHKEPSGDYTEYIMRVINQAILATSQVDEQEFSQLTIFQKFKDFIQNLIWISKEDCYAKVISSFTDQNKKKPTHLKQTISTQEIPENNQELIKSHHAKKNAINKFFRQTTISNASQALRMQGERTPQISEENREKQIGLMKKNRQVEVGQKLPPSIEIFSKNDMKDRNFSAKHSSVLRVITKWAQNLQSIFENAQKIVLNRNYPFTTLSGKSFYPTTQLKQKIYEQIKQMKDKKNKIQSDLIAKNKIFQSYFLSNNVGDIENLTRFIKRYTQTRVIASKMNTLIIKFMQEYVSQLINLLIEAGKMQQSKKNDQKGQVQYINLISFRIGDLMRARMHVNEASFIRVLRTLYLLDQSQSKENPFLKLVRVKNKLDQKDNNVLINFLFMGKIQCELQISCQKMQGKQQKYYTFSHFLYELSRGSFGILSECAIIISQHDPIASSPSYYQAKKFMPIQKNIMTEKVKQMLEGKHSIFICIKCNRLITNESKHIFQKNKSVQNICNACFIKFFNKKDFKSLGIQKEGVELIIQNFLSNPQLSAWMSQVAQSSQAKKLLNYGELAQHKTICLIFSINQKYNEIDYHLLVYDQTDFQWNIVHLNDNILFSEEIQDQDFDIKNITSKVKGQSAFKELTYIELTLNKINMADLIKANKKIPPEVNLVNKLYQIQQKAKSVIARGDIEDIIKNKNQTIAFNKNIIKMDMMQQLSQNIPNINHIQYIFAQELELTKIPQWISKTDKVKLLNLNNNKIKDAKIIQKMHQLKQLYLSTNQIEQINFTQLVKLQKLTCQSNSLSSFVSSELPNLLELNLNTNSIRQIDLSRFPVLQNLKLAYNSIVTLKTKNISQNLQVLILSNNALTSQILDNLPASLRQLSIDNNGLQTIDYRKLPRRLTSLDISGNRLTSLAIGEMPFLTKLQASNNYSLSSVLVFNVPRLTELSMDNCLISDIQKIYMPVGMQWISFCNNSIETIFLKDMTNIDNLNLTGNKIKKLQLKNCKVKILTLYSNNLQTLDNIIIPYTVQRLFLKTNNLKSVTLNNFPFLQILNLESNKLTELNIDNMPNLKELALDYNDFSSIDNINIPQKLEKLFVRKNMLDKLNLSDLRQLNICVLDQNPLNKVSFKNMPKLGEVGLMSTRIESFQDIDLPNTVTKVFMHYNLLKQITYRNMPNLFLIVHQGNQLTQAILQNLPNLTQVYLNENKISTLSMKKLPKLQKLILPNNNLSDITLKDMPFLKTITLTSNQLTQIDLNSVSLVENVTIDCNQLKQIHLKDLTGLISLNLSGNQIVKCKLQNLPLLNNMNLTYNQITQIKLYRLKSLKELQLSDNPIEVFELVGLKLLESIFLSTVKFRQWTVESMPKLKNINIYSGAIQQIIFKKIESLQNLNVWNNKLKSLNFNEIPNLKTINCQGNQFQTLRIQGLKELTQIYFNLNKLTSVQFIDLPRLTHVNLRQNQINSISLIDLPKLQSLSLQNNKLTQIDLNSAKIKQPIFLNISNNILQEFQAHHNYSYLTINQNPQIKKIIIRDLLDLMYIQAINNPELKQLVLQNCPKIQTVQFTNNQGVDSIKFKNLPQLKYLRLTQTIFKNITFQEKTNPILNITVANAELQTLLRTQNPNLVATIENATAYQSPSYQNTYQ